MFNRVQANNTYLDGKPWENIISEDSVMITNNIKAKNINATFTKLNQFNGYNFNEVIDDTVFKGKDDKIKGHKLFSNLTLFEARVENGINTTNLINYLFKPFKKEKDFQITPNLIIKNLNISSTINDVPVEAITPNVCKDVIITGEQIFGKVTSYKNTFIKGNRLNGLNITQINEDTLKIYEPFEFESVDIGKTL